MDANMSFLDSSDLGMARILILLNLREGMLEEMEMIAGNITCLQKLDYEGIPFLMPPVPQTWSSSK